MLRRPETSLRVVSGGAERRGISLTHALQTCEPMKPDAPVTATVPLETLPALIPVSFLNR